MAEYYIDGTIVSTSGTGSGTQNDPWGKTDDIMAYAVDQVINGPGGDANGDTFFIVDGDITSTTTPMINVNNTSVKSIHVIGNGREKTTWNTNGNNYFTPYSTTNPTNGAGNGPNVYLSDLTVDHSANIGTSSGGVDSLWGRSGHAYNCDLLMYNSSIQTGVVGRISGHNQVVNLYGCRWYKGFNVLDSRASSIAYNTVIVAAPDPSFERNSYGGYWINCIFDWRAAANSNGRGIVDYNPTCIGCTFLLNGTTRWVSYSNFDDSSFIDCYVEGGTGFLGFSNTHGSRLMAGNRKYDQTNPEFVDPTNLTNPGYNKNNTVITSSGLKDAGSDNRPNNILSYGYCRIPTIEDVNDKGQLQNVGAYPLHYLTSTPYAPRMRG